MPGRLQRQPDSGEIGLHLVVRRGRKSAVWAAYEVTPGSIGIASSLSRDLIRDDWVSESLTAADLAALAEQEYVRSQHVPLVSFAGTPYWREVNFASNATVRSRSLSQGAWYGLDWSLRNLVNREAAVYVYTGAIFDPEAEPRLLTEDSGYRIPDKFFKIVLTEDGRAAAFLFPQDTAVHVHHCDLRAGIEEIEALSGLDFFRRQRWKLNCRYILCSAAAAEISDVIPARAGNSRLAKARAPVAQVRH